MLPLSFVLLAVFAPDSTVSDSSAPRDEDKLPKSNVKITSKELSHHVHFLAGDELRGRKAGTEDAHRAARYLVRALERAGFEPGGDDGTFLQRVPLRQTVWTAPHQLTVHTDG